MSTLAGTIITEPVLKDNKFKDRTFFLSIERSSGTKDVLEIRVPSYIKDELKLNDKACFVGQITSFNEYEGTKRKLKLFFLVKETKEYVKDINDIEINGTICSKLNLRETPLKRKCADLTIAYNSTRHSNYIPTILWGKCAESCSKVFKIGDPVKVLGRFQSRPYTKMIDDKPVEMVAYELSVSKIFNVNLENNSIEIK